MKSLIKELEKIKSNNYLVIVEGKKDKVALTNIGLTNIITLENRPLFEVVESIGCKDVVILTDLDVEGRKLFNKLRYNLQRNGKRVHSNIRLIIFRLGVRHIEGLDTFMVHNLYKPKSR